MRMTQEQIIEKLQQFRKDAVILAADIPPNNTLIKGHTVAEIRFVLEECEYLLQRQAEALKFLPYEFK